MNPKSKEAVPRYGNIPPPVRGGAEVVLPAQYTPPGSPLKNTPLPDGRDARTLRYVPLYSALSALDLEIDSHMGAAELIRIYEKALLAKAGELSGKTSWGAHSFLPDALQRALRPWQVRHEQVPKTIFVRSHRESDSAESRRIREGPMWERPQSRQPVSRRVRSAGG